MKRVLIALGIVLASTTVLADTIKITWPFGPDVASQPMRLMADQANKLQKNDTYVLEFKTGAAGVVAVNAVSSDKNESILAHSGAFFIVPEAIDPPGYNVNDWQMIDSLCDLPFVVASKKYKSFKDIPRNEIVSIGHAGNGTTTHLIAEAIRKKYPNLLLVPYKSVSAAGLDLMGGHVDLIVSLPGDTFIHEKDGKMTVLAVTGTNKVNGVPTLGSLGIPAGDQLITGYFYFASKSANEQKVKNWMNVLGQTKTKEVTDLMTQNYCKPSTLKPSQYDARFNELRDFWKKEVSAIKPK